MDIMDDMDNMDNVDDKKDVSQKRKKWIIGIGLAVFLMLFFITARYIGEPLVTFAKEPEEFQRWIKEQGALGPVLFFAMTVLQVIVAVIPGAPFQIAAGYAFGIWWGTIISTAATVLGGALVFLAVRKWGVMAVEVFFSMEQVQSLPIIRDKKRLYFWTYMLLLIPGSPKDCVSYAAGLTPLPFSHWLVLSACGRLPSIVASVIGGNALGTANYGVAAIAFLICTLAGGLGVLAYRKIQSRNE